MGNEIDHGHVIFDGKILKLTQEAYCHTDFSIQHEVVDRHGFATLVNPHAYIANAIDENGESYEIKWKIVREDCEDESEACEWEKPASIRKL